ncbi:hypothetical protein D9M72_547020 [compost metagenome]
MAARLREEHAPLVALEQPDLELFFERLDLDAQRRLRNVQALRGAREVELLGDGDEIAEMAQFHDIYEV